jgi:hypothetical protein
MAKSVEDRIVASAIHGIIAAANEKWGEEAATDIAERAIELTEKYLAGEEVDDFTMNEFYTNATIEMLNETFTGQENATKQGYPNA